MNSEKNVFSLNLALTIVIFVNIIPVLCWKVYNPSLFRSILTLSPH